MAVEFSEIKAPAAFQMANFVHLAVQRISAVFDSGVFHAVQNGVKFLITHEECIMMRLELLHIEKIQVCLAYRNYSEVSFWRVARASPADFEAQHLGDELC